MIITRPLSRLLLTASLIVLLQACGGGGASGGASSTDNGTCSTSQVKSWIHDNLASEYLWNTQIQSLLNDTLLRTSASTSASYFDALLWKPAIGGKDRYSFIYSQAQYSAATTGENIGFGINWAGMTEAGTTTLRARYVEPGSPAAIAGIARGDTLTVVNGEAYNYASRTQAQYDALYPQQAGTQTSLSVVSASGGTKNVTLTAVTVTANPVMLSKVITSSNNQPVGYFVFNSFMASSGSEQLINTFRNFKQAGIQDLIVDLRYNGGGYLSTAQLLGSLIGGSNVNGKVFYTYVHNSNRSHWNSSNYFDTSSISDAMLNLPRVFILTDRGTASASEALIMGLKPFVNVIRIGQTTYGKPTGMYVTQYCDSVYLAINFEGVNANNEGGYYDGIASTCSAADDLSHALGDTPEAMLAAALAYQSSGQCLSASYSRRGNHVQPAQPLQENPLLNNLIIQR